MPWSANGIGTTYYGKDLVSSDGSYVVTEWIIIFGLPIVPIGSRRVWPQPSMPWSSYKIRNDHHTTTTQYKIQKVPLYWPQIVKTYLKGVLGLIGIMIFLFIFVYFVEML